MVADLWRESTQKGRLEWVIYIVEERIASKLVGRLQTEQDRAEILWEVHEGFFRCRQPVVVLMVEAVANIACDMLAMSLSEMGDEAIGGRKAWLMVETRRYMMRRG
jgi:hypothetical protein